MINLCKNLKIVINLALADFKKRFVGSYFGVIWMFVQPLATILVYTLIFQVGFKSVPPVPGVPYVIWLIPGIIPWFYFQDAVIQGTNVLYEYNYLVKKIVFNVSMLPVVKLVSVLLSHICFVIIMFIVFMIARVPFSVKSLLVVYFTLSLSVFSLGIIYLTSAINVFFKDMGQIVTILMQFGMWMAPIMYDESLFANRAPILCKLIKLNPIYYIVKGYRFCMINDNFPSFFKLTAYYWVVTIIVFIFGYKVFNKLKLHFSDVL